MIDIGPIKPAAGKAKDFEDLIKSARVMLCSPYGECDIPHENIGAFVNRIETLPVKPAFEAELCSDSTESCWSQLVKIYDALLGKHIERLLEEISSVHRKILDTIILEHGIKSDSLQDDTIACLRAAFYLLRIKKECLNRHQVDQACIAIEAFKGLEIEIKQKLKPRIEERYDLLRQSVNIITEEGKVDDIVDHLHKNNFLNVKEGMIKPVTSVIDDIRSGLEARKITEGMFKCALILALFGHEYTYKSSLTGMPIAISNPLGCELTNPEGKKISWICRKFCSLQKMRNELVHEKTYVPTKSRVEKVNEIVTDCIEVLSVLQDLKFIPFEPKGSPSSRSKEVTSDKTNVSGRKE